jgi:hypothetical protein
LNRCDYQDKCHRGVTPTAFVEERHLMHHHLLLLLELCIVIYELLEGRIDLQCIGFD